MLLDEPLVFERGAAGRIGWPVAHISESDTDAVIADLPPALRRDDGLAGFPEISELEAVRHFVRLSQWNYSAATTLYPLGSCTMKYNPVVNEAVARLPGFAALHPLVPDQLAQGALELIAALEHAAQIADQLRHYAFLVAETSHMPDVLRSAAAAGWTRASDWLQRHREMQSARRWRRGPYPSPRKSGQDGDLD